MTSTETVTQQAFDEQNVQGMVARWYQALDRHDELAPVLTFLIDDGLEFHFPEGIFRGHAEFAKWYEAVTHRFFDEVHTVKDATITAVRGNEAEVKVVVNWRAKVWNPPAPRSEWLGFDAYQTWTVVPGPSGEVLLKTYVVDELRPMPGSASL